jgi:hypothetical protein
MPFRPNAIALSPDVCCAETGVQENANQDARTIDIALKNIQSSTLVRDHLADYTKNFFYFGVYLP